MSEFIISLMTSLITSLHEYDLPPIIRSYVSNDIYHKPCQATHALPSGLTTDTSLLGWGEQLHSSEQVVPLGINISHKPTRTTVCHTCSHFLLVIRNNTRKILMNNIVSIFYINQQGLYKQDHTPCAPKWWDCGTGAPSRHWHISFLLPGCQNTTVVALSRKFSQDPPWEINAMVL